jgi:hypothetical protein
MKALKLAPIALALVIIPSIAFAATPKVVTPKAPTPKVIQRTVPTYDQKYRNTYKGVDRYEWKKFLEFPDSCKWDSIWVDQGVDVHDTDTFGFKVIIVRCKSGLHKGQTYKDPNYLVYIANVKTGQSFPLTFAKVSLLNLEPSVYRGIDGRVVIKVPRANQKCPTITVDLYIFDPNVKVISLPKPTETYKYECEAPSPSPTPTP